MATNMDAATFEAIFMARSLRDLVAALNAYQPAECNRLEDEIDLHTLPTFGDIVPEDTTGIWSWDERYVMVFNVGDGKFELKRWDDAAR